MRGRDDGDAEATEDLRQVGRLGVDPQTRLGDTADAGDGTLAVLPVLQGHGQGLADLALGGLGDLVGGDVALLLEDLGDTRLDLRVGHRRLVVVRLVGVTQTRQHVCDRIGHAHGSGSLFLTAVSGAVPRTCGVGS
ncbi:hypothetical protein SDC9_212278 [bioreactor metagenome]|uniref:Uncharacterized protein n=1 Tax=bioreactor metagenome TaxID=1076179 RepID=A0A645JZW9_9ZZZZ